MRENEISIIKLGVSALIIGLLADLYVQMSKSCFIPVKSSFVTDVYAALFTIAALTGTVLTIIISSSSTKHYGFSLREILYFKSLDTNFSIFIPYDNKV